MNYENYPEYDKINFERKGINRWWFQQKIVPLIRMIKGNKCENCDSDKNIDVHHTDYDIWTINTLFLLCKKCHVGVHRGLIKNKRFQVCRNFRK